MLNLLIRYSIVFLFVKLACCDLDEWRAWKQTYDQEPNGRLLIKSEEQRYKTFQSNLKKIKEHNLKYYRNETSYKLALNQFADKNESELFNLFYTNLNEKELNSNLKYTRRTKLKKSNLRNDTVNWITTGRLAPVPNQGGKCGSCYAFASV